MLQSGQRRPGNCRRLKKFTQSNLTKARSATLKNSSSRDALWRTAGVHGAKTNLHPRKRTSSFVCTDSVNMRNGTSGSTTRTPRIQNKDINFPTAILKMSIAVPYSRRKAGLACLLAALLLFTFGYIFLIASAVVGLAHAEALIIATEWSEFANVDLVLVKQRMI